MQKVKPVLLNFRSHTAQVESCDPIGQTENAITPPAYHPPRNGLSIPKMSSLNFINEDGPGQKLSDTYHYSQVVHIPGTPIVKASGQGGWNEKGALDAGDIEGQVRLAFQNVDNVLRAAGLRGWEDVYLLRTYAVDMDAAFPHLSARLRERIPDHRPLWTALSVPRLATPDMLIEIEVEAYKPQQ